MLTAIFDIEAGGLKAPFDQVLCCGIKPYGKPAKMLARSPKDTTDKQLLIDIYNELMNYDLLIGYYSLGYDKPFLNARLLKNGLPILPRQLHIDCYRYAKKIFGWSLNNRRLITVCELLGIEGKTRVDPAEWEKMKYAAEADKGKALKQIIEHCREDVNVLEKAYDQCFKHAIISVSMA